MHPSPDPDLLADVGAEVRRRGAADVTPIWRTLEDLHRTGLHPALQVAIRHRGELVLNRALGVARNGPRDSARSTVDTPFVLFSATKPLTALVIHLLVEDGVLGLDDPVAEYLPEFSRYEVGSGAALPGQGDDDHDREQPDDRESASVVYLASSPRPQSS